MRKFLISLFACIMVISIMSVVSFAASKPSAPSINSYTPINSSSIKIGWNKVSGAAKYRVDRRKSDESNYKTLTSSCTSTSYTDNGLKAGSKYYYRIYAISNTGTSNRSVTYEAHTKSNAPIISSVNRDSDTQLTIKWNKVPGAAKYKIMYRREDKKDYQTLISNVTDTSYTHKNLTSNAKYLYRVYAVQEADIGPEGNRNKKNIESEPSKTLGNFTKISRPSNGISNDTPNIVKLTWKQAYGINDYSYDIYRKAPTDSKFIKIKRTKDLTYTDIELTPGVIYQYKINTVTTSDGGSCTWSDIFYAGPKIKKEINLTPQSATSMKISWDKPLSETGLKYAIYKWDGSKYNYYTTTSNTYYIDNNLKTNETYRYYIQIRDNSDCYLTSTYGKTAVLQILPEKIALNKTSASMTVGDTLTLSEVVSPNNSTDKSIVWSSSNINVAEVSSKGVVTAKKIGNAVITVKTSNGKSAKCSINVTNCKHTYGNWLMDSQATCTNTGKHHRICGKCSEREEEDIPMLEHSYTEEVIEPECITDGSKEKVCIKCGYRTDKEIIPAKGHSYSEEWLVEQEPNCISEGSEYRQCKVCNEKEIRIIEKKQHEYELIKETEPTGTIAGSRDYKCKICGNEYSDTYWPEKNEGTILIEDKYMKAGETILIPIKIKENPGIAGFSFKISYDENIFEPVSTVSGGTIKYISAGNVLKDAQGDIGELKTNLDTDKDNNPITVVWNNVKKVTGDGELFYIALKAKSTSVLSDYSIKLEYENITDGTYDIIPGIINGTITVVDFLPGDVNQDGRIDARDGILLSQNLAGWKRAHFTEAQKKAADLFKDGNINIKDSVSFIQKWSNNISNDSGSIITLSNIYNTDKKTTIRVNECYGLPGEYVDVPIIISDNSGIAGFNFKISYDKSKLTPIEVIKGDVLSGEITSNLQEENINLSELNFVTACCSDIDNSNDNGVLCTIRFLIKDSAALNDTIPIEISQDKTSVCGVSNQNIEDTEVLFVQGNVNITNNPLTQEYLYEIENVVLKTDIGEEVLKIPANGDFYADINFHTLIENFVPATVFATAYDTEGKIININMQSIKENDFIAGNIKIHINKCIKDINTMKVFIWDSVNNMKPLAGYYQIN